MKCSRDAPSRLHPRPKSARTLGRQSRKPVARSGLLQALGRRITTTRTKSSESARLTSGGLAPNRDLARLCACPAPRTAKKTRSRPPPSEAGQRYHFDTYDGERFIPDEDGIALRGLDEAKAEAMRALPDMAKEATVDGARDFVVEVRDEAGRKLLRVRLSLVLSRSPDGGSASFRGPRTTQEWSEWSQRALSFHRPPSSVMRRS